MSLSRFKGCLVGAVIADCFGSIFEGVPVCKVSDVVHMIDRKFDTPRTLQKQAGTRPASKYGLAFTDDTAMARSVAASLIEKNGFNAKDMAKRFAQEYHSEPGRGYGSNVVTVFEALVDPHLEDVFQPASAQFNGSGSYGNGGAMRIAPAPLFAHFDSVVDLRELVSSITRLTHTHKDAVNGAVLQALAIRKALLLPSNTAVNTNEFLDYLIAKMKDIEQEDMEEEEPLSKKMKNRRSDSEEDNQLTTYCAKLEKIKEFLEKEDLQVKEVVEVLGNNVSALGSVPAAILSFLKTAKHDQPGMEGHNKFEQTVIYAVSLGGDTDTIGTMAAAIAGALYGMDSIPEAWQYYSEGVADAETFAEKLYHRGTSGD